MTEERDEKVSQRYRELGREEPPRALDEAILAAARRPPRSLASRWTVPVSLAAVVMLSVTVTLMVREEAPEKLSIEPVARAPAPVVTETEKKLREADAPRAEAAKVAEAPKPPAPKAGEPKADLNAMAKQAPATSDERAKLMKEQVAQPPKEEARARPAERPSFVPDPAPASNRAASGGLASSAPPPPAAALAPPPAPAAPMAQRRVDEGARDRAESQVLSEATAKRMQDATETPEKWLERIAEMRLAGKHEEADKALAEFRKRHPDYRISEQMLQRVERRGMAR
jgi:hypothetical protein